MNPIPRPPGARLRALALALTRRALLPLLLSGLAGCVSPWALDHMSVAYNQVTADDISKQLLLNIGRAKHNEPIHFSGIASIAATLNFEANFGITPPLTGDIGKTVMPLAGISGQDNPTITIVPMQGEEFTKRMLTPLTEDKLILLLRQNLDVDMLLRLTVLEFRSREHGRERIYHNRPRDREDYEVFRRVVLHLSSIQDRDELYFEPLNYRHQWTLPAANMTPEGFQALEKEYEIVHDPGQEVYRLSKPVAGHILITNYDPAALTAEERSDLHAEARQSAPNDLLVDIRPDFPGGEYPLHGVMRLRSFSNILYAIGRALSDEPEREVGKDPRTPSISENPVTALAISETDSPPPHTDLFVEHHGKYYAVGPDQNYPWNRMAFRMLWQLFQMTMAELPSGFSPSITIAK